MMKRILLFILFFLIGCFSVIGYAYIYQQKAFFSPSTPKITTKFSLANAPSESLKGNIASMSGTVNWLSRTASSSVRIEKPQTIQQGEELTTGKNGNAAVVIQNAEAIILSPNTDINFIQLLPINLVLEQNSGTVTYQNTGQNALSVDTQNLITGIDRGTAEIVIDKKTNSITVTVEKGVVTEGYEDSSDTSNVVSVAAGQQFIFDDTALAGTVEGEEVNTNSFLN